jgi:hypothetical protein
MFLVMRMNKQELINKINKNAISLIHFFKWIGYKEYDSYSVYHAVSSFRKSNRNDKKIIKLIECFEIMNSIDIREYLAWKKKKSYRNNTND